jgi:hypothetical protein
VKIVERVIENDEGPRPDSSLEGLAKLRPVFAAKGSVTAGNASQMSDGAGAVLLVSEKILKQFNLKPIARFRGFAVAGVPPEIMGIGPIEAIPRVLKQAGVNQDDVDWIELNEAFAAQALAVMRTLELDPQQGEPARRRHRARPSARRHRRHPHRHRDGGDAARRGEIRHGHHVHRHRHGGGRAVRVRGINLAGREGALRRPFSIQGGER